MQSLSDFFCYLVTNSLFSVTLLQIRHKALILLCFSAVLRSAFIVLRSPVRGVLQISYSVNIIVQRVTGDRIVVFNPVPARGF